jgi:hypothetical protein
MRAMNAYRRFLLRGGMASRLAVLAAFAVLLARALLPGAVMLDPVSAAQGDFALVICSGHGPMFVHDAGAMMNMSGDDDMSHMAGMMHDDPHMSGSSGAPMQAPMASDDGLCPFSAALFVACVSVSLAIVLFALAPRIAERWRVIPARRPAFASTHLRPLSRAPPTFG